ncbi:hypothetical protein RIF29_27063 [Crotalaria pallida]|uniref:1-phosphatidylinositol-4-phosphate 5-kinase n=1 Tax=Crotalaria pallida TaxID=3830 RepID=A0AAN9EP07_CROPI
MIAGLARSSTAIIPGGYHPLYYGAATGVVLQAPPRAGLMFNVLIPLFLSFLILILDQFPLCDYPLWLIGGFCELGSSRETEHGHFRSMLDSLKSRKLRKIFQGDPTDYMLAICGDMSLREFSSHGKSGSFFYLTQDDRFMIKTVKKSEVKFYLYFDLNSPSKDGSRSSFLILINDLPTISEVVTGMAKKQGKEKSSVSNHSYTKAKSNSKKGFES